MAVLAQRLIYYKEKYVEVIMYLPCVSAQHAGPVFELKQMPFSSMKNGEGGEENLS